MELLHRLLTVIFADWGGLGVFTDPDSKPVLGGGLALLAGGEVLVEPTCCLDLGNLTDWKKAAAYRGGDWQMLWIGHPWLSVRYDCPWLIICDPHESDSPTERWAVGPDDLDQAVAEAEAELEAFARRMQPVLKAMGVDEVERNARRLAGLEE